MRAVTGGEQCRDVEKNDSKRTSGRSGDHVSPREDDRHSAARLTLVGIRVPR